MGQLIGEVEQSLFNKKKIMCWKGIVKENQMRWKNIWIMNCFGSDIETLRYEYFYCSSIHSSVNLFQNLQILWEVHIDCLMDL